jgi:hypothetical protein
MTSIQLDSQSQNKNQRCTNKRHLLQRSSRLKALNSPILLKISITLILVLAFLPIWGPYTTMYVRRPGPFVNMLDFQQPKSNAFDVILLQDKRTIDRFRFADTPWV